MAALEAAVERLESGELTLEESMREFEKGFQAWRRCQELLRQAQRRIEILCEETEGVAGTESWSETDSRTESEGGGERLLRWKRASDSSQAELAPSSGAADAGGDAAIEEDVAEGDDDSVVR